MGAANIMETFRRTDAFGADEWHKRIQAMKLAYAYVNRYNADPRAVAVPVHGLLSKDYAHKHAASIDPQQANCSVPFGKPVNGDTTYLTVLDRAGNIASWIQSITGNFGSSLTTRGLRTIIPAFMEKGDEHIDFGIMGAANQPLAHAQFVSNTFDFEMNPPEALEASRRTEKGTGGREVYFEDRVPLRTLQELSSRRLGTPHTSRLHDGDGCGQDILHNSRANTNFALRIRGPMGRQLRNRSWRPAGNLKAGALSSSSMLSGRST